MKSKDLLVLSHLRRNARMPLTKMSRATKIPVSTIFDKLKEMEQRIIDRHTVLMDFRKLGFDLKVNMLLKLPQNNRVRCRKFLRASEKVNSISAISNGFDFLIECIFKDMDEMNAFVRSLDPFQVMQKEDYFVLEDIKREEFLANADLMVLDNNKNL